MNIKQTSAKLFKPAVDMGRGFLNPIERAECKKPPSPAAEKLTHYTIPADAAEKISEMLGALER